MRVLVTDGASNKSLAAVRGIGDYASFVGVESAFPISVAGSSRYADKRYWIRGRTPNRLVERLNEIIEIAEIDQLLPIRGRTFEIVSDYRDDLSVPVGKILPPREAMDTAIDKRRTHELAERVGVPTPTTMTAATADSLSTVEERIGYPAVVKSGTETEKRFVEVVNTIGELESAYREYTASADSAPLVQEYLPGASRGYFAFYIDGTMVGGYAHQRIREYPPEGGASACAVSKCDVGLRRYAEMLLSELGWNGVAMVEFKDSAEGIPKVVEINPKFWGSLDLAIESGLNFPRAMLELSAGKREFEFDFTPSCVSWPLSGDLTHAWRRPSSAPEILEDLLSPHVKTNIRLTDPLPHVVEMMVTLVRRDL